MPERYERPPSYWGPMTESSAYLDQYRALLTARVCMIAFVALVALWIGVDIRRKR